MSIQDKISRANIKAGRKLFDERLAVSGGVSKVIRLQFQRDDFGDEEGLTLLNHEEVEVEIIGLEGIPLSRLRKNLNKPLVQPTTSLYLYDVLPIIVRTKFSTNIQKDDILVKRYFDDNDVSKYYYLTLQITEVVGTFNVTDLVSMEFNAAPYIQTLPSSIEDIINTY